ncbi:DUF2788 domain-containing protein [Candidatus Venteria ishoeyi]|uniref:DUF2788 domain-containing protein n=2 Tax=Candidatus Venteria ishoeyi TaxID=1899563 RepID=A0A1H6FFH2_9GAMM|nr:DUF2788 domain-containing protein [Candidatus Venteria ishoeyi]MDM8547414.1 DUF2788 domain-containing protein [Candidatus Venteria ishoeyi]SEH08812.1 Uncharacterised protein [Candidatus Venteria ishoeyi]
MLNMTLAEFESWSLTLGLGGLMFYMFFIIYDLAKQSNAGKYGYIALFLVLGLGMAGFIFKLVITEMMDL